MLKLLGAVCVVGAAAWFGFHLAGRFAARPRQIRHLQNGLQLLETEIVYGSTPLAVALHKAGQSVPDPVGAVFRIAARNLTGRDGRPTHECWDDAVNTAWPFTALRPVEQEIFRQLGHALGRSDRQDQQKHIQLALLHLGREEQEARDEQGRYEKLSKSLGLLGGLLIALLIY